MTMTNEELIQQNEALQARLEAAEEALRAIQSGEVDALVIYREDGDQIYTLEGADHSYRVMVEKIQEGVATLQSNGMILYANQRLAEMLAVPLENLLGASLLPYIQAGDQNFFQALLRKGADGASKSEMTFYRNDRSSLPVLLSMTRVENKGEHSICLIATDLTEQKRQEEILAAERLARSILDQAAEAIVVCDTHGTIIRASQATDAIAQENPLFQSFEQAFPLFYNESQLTGERFSIQTVLMGKSYQGFETRLTSHLTAAGEQPAAIEQPAAMKQPAVRYLLLSAAPLRNDYQEIIGCIVTLSDITDRKKAEQRIAAEKEWFRTTLASIGDAVITTDPQERVIYLNPVAEQLTGWTTQEAAGQPMECVFPIINEQTGQPVANPVGKVIQSGRMVGLANHTALHTRNGRFIPIEDSAAPIRDADGQVLGVIMVFHDVTEKRRADDTLRESENRFRVLADAMPVLVWTARPDGSIDYYNRRHQEYDGLERQEDGTWQVFSSIHPDDLPSSMDAWQQALKTGDTFQAEMRLCGADGSFRWHLNRAIPNRDDQGQVIKWYGTATDIQGQKQAEAQLEEFARKLRRSNQELEQFAFVASHDLREPLRKIRMFGNSLERQLGKDLSEEAEDSLTRIKNAAGRMEAMIESLLELSRVNTHGGKFKVIQLSQVAEEAVSDLEARVLKSQGEVILGDLPTAEVDPLQFRQLFQNLINNGLKFHKPDVPPIVQVFASITRTGKEPEVKITVEDNGIGFDEQYVEQIFQPFKRLHGRDEFEGTGIGLAICQKIVERHHGKIEVHSKLGEGSRFIIHLPIQQSP